MNGQQTESMRLDCRLLAHCAGPCASTRPAVEEDSRATRSAWEMPYFGHTTQVVVVNAFVCRGCWRRWREFMDIWEFAAERGAEREAAEVAERLEADARAVLRKFAAATPGGVQHACEEATGCERI